MACNRELRPGHVYGIEVDVRVNECGDPILSHDYYRVKDADRCCLFDVWLQVLKQQLATVASDCNTQNKIIIKLDFKEIDPLQQVAHLLKDGGLQECSWWINADILPGPGSTLAQEPLDATLFLNLVSTLFPTAVLSLGWTTNSHKHATNHTPKGGVQVAYQPTYTIAMVEQMLALCTELQLKNVTFPIRCCYIQSGWDVIRKLLDHDPAYSLTLWEHTDDYVCDTGECACACAGFGRASILRWCDENLPVARCTYDCEQEAIPFV